MDINDDFNDFEIAMEDDLDTFTVAGETSEAVVEDQTKSVLDMTEPESSYWRYFKRNPSSNTGKCYICSKVISQGPTKATTGFLTHCSPVTSSKLRDQIEGYLKEKLLGNDNDPLDYWQREVLFPDLKRMAMKYLSAPPSSVESERTFSTLGGIYNPKRSSLSGEHGKQQLFLHYNL